MLQVWMAGRRSMLEGYELSGTMSTIFALLRGPLGSSYLVS